MHVDVEHRLPGRRAVELGDLHAVRLQFVDQHSGQLLHREGHLAQAVRVDLQQVARLRLLRDHQGMAEGLREQVEEGEHVVVLVQLVARRLATNDHGEDVLRIVGALQAHGVLHYRCDRMANDTRLETASPMNSVRPDACRELPHVTRPRERRGMRLI
ncbi:hypothetical protein D3C76_1053370 [compost metagenome]